MSSMHSRFPSSFWLAAPSSRWITASDARADGHRWRARACAILTGIGTVRSDDPELTVRAVSTPRQPLRVIVDRHAETRPDARALAGGHALIVTAGARNVKWPSSLESLALPDAQGRIDLHALMSLLAQRHVNELHVEAGAALAGGLLRAGLVDECVLYQAQALLGADARPLFLDTLAAIMDWTLVDERRIGPDRRLVLRPKHGD